MTVYEKNGTDVVEITEKGRKKVLFYKLDEIKITQPKKWDGLWRVIAFDIPEKHKVARRALSLKLKEIGLYPLQKSVFIGPFDCLNEINFVGEFFRIRKYIHYFTVNNFENIEQEECLKTLYNL